MGIKKVLAIITLLVTFMRSFLYFTISTIISRITYGKMFTSVKNTSVRFFELNPIGKYINNTRHKFLNVENLFLIRCVERLLFKTCLSISAHKIGPYLNQSHVL